MIQSQSKEVTLIVYDTPKPPRYFKLNKGLIKTLVILIPLMVVTSITLSFMYSIFLKTRISELRSSEPRRITELKKERALLTQQLTEVKKTNAAITDKLSRGSSNETSVSALGLFTVPLGIQDLIKIEDIKVKTDSKIKLEFNLANNTSPNEKLSGYISVIQYQGRIIQFYPSYELSAKNLRLEYNSGESFGFTRFRPTVASFDKVSGTSAKYKIYIFSRTGDLLAYKQLGPFNIENE